MTKCGKLKGYTVNTFWRPFIYIRNNISVVTKSSQQAAEISAGFNKHEQEWWDKIYHLV